MIKDSDIILVKGSRVNKLELVVDKLKKSSVNRQPDRVLSGGRRLLVTEDENKMIYHLLWFFRNTVTHRLGFYAYQEVMFRAFAALLTGLVIALVLGPPLIRWLMRKKIGDRPEFHHAYPQ